ncbi:MAG TPA: hypothetical protein V6C91_23320 [Coleofasciculaceae cyanobacterium]
MHLHSDLLQLQPTVKIVFGVSWSGVGTESIEKFSFRDRMIAAALALKRAAFLRAPSRLMRALALNA